MTKPPQIQLSSIFKIDAREYAIQGNAILGIRDSGKTYTATKVAESLFEAGIPFIAFDPVGVWKNLRVGIGNHKGYPVIVAGGDESSDIQLTADNATQIVHAALKEGVSIIIDLYSPALINKSIWIKIVTDVVNLLMYKNGEYGLRHVFIEEAAEFIPQRLEPQHNKVYSAIERLARMGRNARLGLTIINQRAEQINKAILEICAMTLLHKQVGKNSLKSIEKWLDVLDIENADVVMKSLSRLEKGECFVIGENTGIKRIKVLPKHTYHPSPEDAKHDVLVKKTINVDDFVTRIIQTISASGPGKQVAKPAGSKPDPDKAVLDQMRNQIAELTRLTREQAATIQAMTENDQKTLSLLNSAIAGLQSRQAIPVKIPAGDKRPAPLPAKVPDQAKIPVKAEVVESPQNGLKSDSKSGVMRILKVIAIHDGISRKRIAIVVGMSQSGTFTTYLSSLRTEGLIYEERSEFKATKKGLELSDQFPEPLLHSDALIKMWIEKIGAGSGVARIFEYVAAQYPSSASRHEVGEAIGMSSTSGTFTTYLSTLRTKGLLEGSRDLKASRELFHD